MLGEEPDLQFIQADQVAHDQVICPIVAAVGSLPLHGSRFLQYDLVSFQEAGNLHGYLFTPSGWTWNQCSFRHIRRHREANATQQLNPLGYSVDQFILFAMVLVKQQMELIEREARHLPMMFLVHITKGHRIGEKLVQVFDALGADHLVQSIGQPGDLIERLNFPGMLMQDRFCAVRALFELAVSRTIFFLFADHDGVSSFSNWNLGVISSSGLTVHPRKRLRGADSAALSLPISIRPPQFRVKQARRFVSGASHVRLDWIVQYPLREPPAISEPVSKDRGFH